MSHNYLFELYYYIENRLDAARDGSPDPGGEPPDPDFTEGRIEALEDLKTYLVENLTIKLPKRLRKEAGVIYMNAWKPKG